MRAVGVWPLADATDPIVVWQLDVEALADEAGVWNLLTAQQGRNEATAAWGCDKWVAALTAAYKQGRDAGIMVRGLGVVRDTGEWEREPVAALQAQTCT